MKILIIFAILFVIAWLVKIILRYRSESILSKKMRNGKKEATKIYEELAQKYPLKQEAMVYGHPGQLGDVSLKEIDKYLNKPVKKVIKKSPHAGVSKKGTGPGVKKKKI